ncbi:MAG: NAD-dependent malic enzyme [Acidimicrobiia bacterium]|nr:NAD-dependent malic enzyme [Acidimicrobiia bacterium]
MIETDILYRIKTGRTPGTLAKVLGAIAEHHAHVGEIETRYIGPEFNIRDVLVIAPSEDVVEAITNAITAVGGVELVAEPVDQAFHTHQGGKLQVTSRVKVKTLQDMREIYTPGVARVSEAIQRDPSLASTLTWKGSTVAVVSDGSRVLGLGDIGPKASLPVMEGKALFYSMFIGLNAVPIVLDTKDPEEIIETIVRIAPGFGGIHLEDIASPGVFHIEEELDRRLDIPVMHDDQHGTAIVVMAAVLSAARQLGVELQDWVFGQIGLGAAGSAIARLAMYFPFKRIEMFDPSDAALSRTLSFAPDEVDTYGTTEGFEEIASRVDVLVLTTGQANLLKPEHIRPGQTVMALTNPVPEINRYAAREAGAAVATDGSIVNNVLAYPGLFKGALDAGAARITPEMKKAAAIALSELAPDDALLPDPLDLTVHATVAERVAQAAN